MGLSAADLSALWLTVKLAGTTTLLLLVLGTPLAWWLARSQRWWKSPINALVAMPLILPPTVLGFYLLIAMGPEGPLGTLSQGLGFGLLPFTFPGLVIGSMIYSLPFVVQPIQNAMEALGQRPLEVAATLRAGPWDRFFTVVVPLARPGFLTAAVLGFANTVGEFGVILMIGGNIPNETRVASVAIYDHVEALDYTSAHVLSAVLLLFSFSVLMVVFALNRNTRATRPAFGAGLS